MGGNSVDALHYESFLVSSEFEIRLFFHILEFGVGLRLKKVVRGLFEKYSGWTIALKSCRLPVSASTNWAFTYSSELP